MSPPCPEDVALELKDSGLRKDFVYPNPLARRGRLSDIGPMAGAGRPGMRPMQRVTLVRYRTKPDGAEENEALSRAVFAELRETAPPHVTYALFRDGRDFVHVFINAQADDSSPVTELASFKAFTKDASARWEAPPEQIRLGVQLIESYGLTAAMAQA
jgi:hypothetical protein